MKTPRLPISVSSQQTANRSPFGLPAHICEGVGAGADPENCCDGEQHCARLIEKEAHTERGLHERQWRAAERQQRSRQSGQRGEPLSRQRMAAQLPRQADRQHDEGHRQRCDEQSRAYRVHGRPPIAATRPICRNSKKAGGAKPSSTATSASTRATPSRLRCGGAFKWTPSLDSAGASTR